MIKFIRKNMRFWLICLLIGACSTGKGPRFKKKYSEIHQDFEPYIGYFIDWSKGKVKRSDFKNFTMGYRKYKEASIVGTCHLIAKEVDINKEYWERMDFSQKIELVFHELGHCILKRHHTKMRLEYSFSDWVENTLFRLGIFNEVPDFKDGCKGSIMNPYLLRQGCISIHFKEYIDELFDNSAIRRPQSSCTYKVINKTKLWTKQDSNNLKIAKKVCKIRYKTCLKKFIKKETRVYTALCY